MFSDVVQWLNEKTIFRKDRPIPPIGFKYNHTQVLDGTSQTNTLGTFQAVREIVTFGQPALITKVDLGFSVLSNTGFAIVGASICKNCRLNESFAVAQSNSMLLTITTELQTAVITKQLHFGAYGGYRIETGESLWLLIRGDGTAITLQDAAVYWLAAPGQAMVSTPLN